LQILDDAKPGFVEADLVGHDGGNSSGDFIQSLNFVDIATGPWQKLFRITLLIVVFFYKMNS
jgi:hypothetical protein